MTKISFTKETNKQTQNLHFQLILILSIISVHFYIIVKTFGDVQFSFT